MVPGGFLWLFMGPGEFFMVLGGFLWFFMVPGRPSWSQLGFSWCQVGFLWFFRVLVDGVGWERDGIDGYHKSTMFKEHLWC